MTHGRGDCWRARWRTVRTAWRVGLVAALLLRVVAGLAAVVAGALIEARDPVPVPGSGGFGGWDGAGAGEPGWALLAAGLERFDALWYLALATDGYPVGSGGVPQAAAFFPGYPLAVAAADAVLPGGAMLAASLVSLAATAAAFAGIHRLVDAETGDRRLAQRAVVVWAVFPTSFFLVAPYATGLFLALSVWSLVALRAGRFPAAAVTGFAAGATRHVGALLVLPAAAEVLRRWRAGEPSVWSLVALASAPAGVAAYLGFAWARWGTPLAPLGAQASWQRERAWPWQTVLDAFRLAVDLAGTTVGGYYLLDLAVFVVVVAGVAWLGWRSPRGLALYSAAHVLVWLLAPFPGRPLLSTSRFALAVAPLAWAYAAWLDRDPVRSGWMAASGALFGLHLMAFVTWHFVF